MSKLNYKNILNKEYDTAGSSGSADAAPRMTESGHLSLRGGFANEAISCRLPRPIGLAMTRYKKCGLAMTGECGRSTPLLSSSDLIRGSTWCGLNAPHFTRFAQCGRSMVEMLGVLAVMGVLSVAGIAGYNFAMNRHRANELLNEASKRAVVVAGQVTMGGQNTFFVRIYKSNRVYVRC